MKRFFRLGSVSVISVLILAVMYSQVRAQGNMAVGSWDITVESPRGTNTSLLIIKQEGDKLTGVIKGQRGERPLDSVSVKGNEISFAMTVQAQGQELVISYKGKVEKDSMKGEADFGGFAQGAWSAVPHKEGAVGAGSGSGTGSGAGAGGGTGAGSGAGNATGNAAATATAGGTGAAAQNDLTGTWNFFVELASGAKGRPIFTFKQEGEKLTGTYKGPLGEFPITGTVKGNDVKFSFKFDAQGTEAEASYKGKIDGKDSMKGTAVVGPMGDANWVAKKQ